MTHALHILKLVALMFAVVCMAWTITGQWRKAPVPVVVIIVDLIATVAWLGWLIRNTL